MAPRLTRHPVKIATGCADEHGFLVYVTMRLLLCSLAWMTKPTAVTRAIGT
jgi:hypothetical protein